jgi:hypothetical protein
MYSGYKVKYNELAKIISNDVELYAIGNSIYKENYRYIKAQLEQYAFSNGTLNGTAIEANWFPHIDADIFLSHSHTDEKKAIIFAGYMKKYLNLQTFIDSCIWGYVNDLLKKIDDEFCTIEPGVPGHYYYESRNYSTSHVHMMLTTALMKMINSTECIIFMDTPNSINTKTVVETTNSPWIYAEMYMSFCIQRKKKTYHKNRNAFYGEESYFSLIEEGVQLKKSINIEYLLSTLHLKELGTSHFIKWVSTCSDEEYPLDTLYNIVPMDDK